MSGFKIMGINHLGIAAKDAVKCKWFFKDVLGLDFLGDELVREQQTLTSMFRSSRMVASSEARLELLVPAEGSEESPIAKYLAKKGGGIHHIALSVDSVDEAITAMKRHAVRMIDESPRSGAHHTRIAFVHPESTGGILVEFVQELTQS